MTIPKRLPAIARRHRRARLDVAKEQFRTLMAYGLRADEAAAWAPLLPGAPPVWIARTAKAWREHGFSPTVAAAWNRYGLLSPHQASIWMHAGYTPDEAHFVMAHTGDCAPGTTGQSEPVAEDWLSTGIPAPMVCRFLAADVTNAAEAVQIWNTTGAPELRRALDVLAALRPLRAEP